MLKIIGLLSPFWISVPRPDGTTWNVGLWLNCTGLDCSPLSDTPGWIRATRAFSILSLLSGIACMVCIVLYTYRMNDVIKLKNRKWQIIGITLLPFVTAVLQQIGIGVFIERVYAGEPSPEVIGHLSWTVVFSIGAVLLFTIVCIFLFIALVRLFYGDPIELKKLSTI